MLRRSSFVFAAVLLVAPFAPDGSATGFGPGSGVATLVTTAHIGAFDQEHNWIAWSSETRTIGGQGERCRRVHIRNLATGGTTDLGWEGDPGGDGCNDEPLWLALATDHALWGGFEDCCNDGYGSIATAAPRFRAKMIASVGQQYHAWGDFVSVAGGGSLLVYTQVDVEPVKDIDPSRGFIHCLPHDPCLWRVESGSTWRVVGPRRIRIPTAPPSTLIATAGAEIAVVPANRASTPDLFASPPGLARVEVRDATTGAKLSVIRTAGPVQALAFTSAHVAVFAFAQADKRTELDWYDPRTGEQQGSLAATATSDIGVDGDRAVYRRGRTIYVADLSTKTVTRVAEARALPLGLSIEGNRVAWAENISGSGFVRAVAVP